MPCANRCFITNKGKCARLLNSRIYTCKGSQDSVNANLIYAGQTENMHRLVFVFPLDTFSCDADHKFWQPNLNLVLNVSPHSTQLTLIIGDCAVVKVFNLISLYWRFHAIWSSDINYYQRLVEPVDQSTANKTRCGGVNRARKKNNSNNIPPIKTSYVQKKRIQFCNFSSVFQTLLNSNFINAVYTSKILFFPKIFAKIQVRVIRKCGLYTPVYGSWKICKDSYDIIWVIQIINIY